MAVVHKTLGYKSENRLIYHLSILSPFSSVLGTGFNGKPSVDNIKVQIL